MKKGWIVIVVTILLATGCSGIKVSQDYDPQTDFGSMTTFQWESETQAKSGDPRIDNPLRDRRVRKAIMRVLAEKGFNQSAGVTPTFLIRYQYTLRQKIESSGTSSGFGFGMGSYGHRGGIAIGTGNSIREYDEGALVIDFIDATSQALLWRGTGTQRFNEYDDPEKASREINSQVEQILAQFPPI
jgi:hypothetical protein